MSKISQQLQNRWGKRALELIVLLLIFFSMKTWMQRDMVEGSAPPIKGTQLNGQAFNLQSMQGKAVLLHFWATWCGICKLEQDSIQALSQDHTVITIAMQSGNSDEIKDYMTEQQLSFPVIVDEEGRLARRYGVRAVPSTFIINSEGQISFRESGFTTEWGLRARIWLAQI